MKKIFSLLPVVVLTFWGHVAGQSAPAADRGLAREILEELVEIPTTQTDGTVRAAQAIAARLFNAGFPKEDVQIITLRCERRQRCRAPSRADPGAPEAFC